MKKKLLLFTTACGFIYLTLSSNAGGPAKMANQDYTGRKMSTNSCGTLGCHAGTTGTTTAAIEVRRKDWGASSTPVDGFIAGKEYIVTLKGTNASLTKFGFQLLAVEGDKNSNTQMGSFSNLPAGSHSKALSGIDIIEHDAPMSKDGSGNYTVNVDWTAPATTSAASVTFCAIINGVNGNGQVSGDKASDPVQLTLQNTTSIENVTGSIRINAYPNPIVGNYLNLNMENINQGNYSIYVYNVNGSNIYNNEIKVNANQATATINTERWAAGMYVVHISSGEHQKMITVIKQ